MLTSKNQPKPLKFVICNLCWIPPPPVALHLQEGLRVETSVVSRGCPLRMRVRPSLLERFFARGKVRDLGWRESAKRSTRGLALIMTDPPGNLSPIRLKSSPGRRNARPLSLVIRTCSKALPAKRKVALCYREKGHERTKISLDTPEQRHFVLTSSKIALRPWMFLAVARDDSLANTSMLLDTMSWLVSSVFLICSVVIAPCGKKKKTLH